MAVIIGTLIAPALATSALAATPYNNNDIHITKIVVEPNGPDMNFTVFYDSNFFTRVFSIIFGAKVMEPSIEHLFINFSNVSIVSLDPNSGMASVMIKNISKPGTDGWYVYDATTEFPSQADIIEVHDSDGQVVTTYNSNSLPAISNRMPAYK